MIKPILGALLFVFTSMAATTTILSQATRGPISVTTSAFTIPANLTSVKITVVIAAGQKTDTSKSFQIDCFSSADAGQTWGYDRGFGWVGGAFTDKQGNVNPNPSMTFDADGIAELAGKLYRCTINLPVSLNAGVTATTTP